MDSIKYGFIKKSNFADGMRHAKTALTSLLLPSNSNLSPCKKSLAAMVVTTLTIYGSLHCCFAVLVSAMPLESNIHPPTYIGLFLPEILFLQFTSEGRNASKVLTPLQRTSLQWKFCRVNMVRVSARSWLQLRLFDVHQVSSSDPQCVLSGT